MGKRFSAVVLVLLFTITAPFTAFSKNTNTLGGVKSAIEGVISYKCESEQADSFDSLLGLLSEYAGTYSADWYYIAFSQYGLKCKNQKSIDKLKAKVGEFYSGDLSSVKVTDMQRVAFALSACGEDITDVNGHNLLADATYNRAKVKPLNSQGANSVAYALLLLDSKNYKIPENAETTREKMIEMILKAERKDGGFALFGDYADIDITSIAVQSLAPYKSRDDVRSALNKCIKILSERQDATGGYKSFSNQISCESTAQVILCLTAFGINPVSDSRFVRNGNSVLDGLLTFKLESGAFSHFKDAKADNMATYQALCALVSTYRVLNGEKSFYDFTEKPAPKEVEVKKKTSKPKDEKSKTTSKHKKTTKTKSQTITSPTEKPTDKVEFVTKPQKPKTKKNTKTKTSETEAVTAPTEGTSKVNYNSSKENKPETENNRAVPYISCAALALGYVSLVIIKRRQK